MCNDTEGPSCDVTVATAALKRKESAICDIWEGEGSEGIRRKPFN